MVCCNFNGTIFDFGRVKSVSAILAYGMLLTLVGTTRCLRKSLHIVKLQCRVKWHLCGNTRTYFSKPCSAGAHSTTLSSVVLILPVCTNKI